MIVHRMRLALLAALLVSGLREQGAADAASPSTATSTGGISNNTLLAYVDEGKLWPSRYAFRVAVQGLPEGP